MFSVQTIVLLLPLSFQITADCMCEPNSSPRLSWQMARSYRQGEWIPDWEQSSNLDGGSAYSVPDCQKIWVSSNNLYRAFKKFLSSRLIMNGRQLWNSHPRHKFLKAEASRDILKFRVSEMAFPELFKRYFPARMPCCFIRIHARLRTMPSKCPRCSKPSHGSNISQI